MTSGRIAHRGWCLTLAIAVTASGAIPARAQEPVDAYPSRNILMVVPYPPGGAPDVIIRIIGKRLGEILGKPIVVENRPGASTTIGAISVARAEPNGYTLLATDIAQTVAPSTMANAKFDPVKDLKPISLTARSDFTVAINPQVPAKSLRELVEYSKQNPDALKAGHPGVGTPPHLFALSLIESTGMKALLVPYRGIALAATDVVAGHIHMVTSVPGVTGNLARDGKLRLVAVGGAKRMASFPDVPNLDELGVKLSGFDMGNWFGITAPAGTPDAIISKINAAVKIAVVDKEAIESLAKVDVDMIASSPAEFGALLASQVATWRTLTANAGIKPE